MRERKSSKSTVSFGKNTLVKFSKSIWFFPVLLLIPLFLLTCSGINGSSIGNYHPILYGSTPDKALLFGTPELIRSDEWVVNTQMTLAQKNDGYARINKHIGQGQDMSIVLDVPYKEWSELFKPHNWSFFILPFDNAFAFKWWILSYLLVVSAYFFSLALLPKKRLLASLLALALLFSPFIQWWYAYGTLGSIYLPLFMATAFIHLLRSEKIRQKIIWGSVLSYLAVSFALILYPPFQIPCGIAMIAFCFGYLLEYKSSIKTNVWKLLLPVLISSVTALLIVGIFFVTRAEAVHAIAHTSYPGARVVNSGGYDLTHFFSGSVDYQLQNPQSWLHYNLPNGITNQSEDSSFLLLSSFLVIPSLWILYRNFKKHKLIDWLLLATTTCYFLFVGWLFMPHLSIVGKVMLLNKVPLNRIIIGFGLLNLMQTVLFIRNFANSTKSKTNNLLIVIYSILVLIFCLFISFIIHRHFPEFISIKRAIVLSIPLPLVIYLLLRKKSVAAVSIYLLFSIMTSYHVNPLYKGTDVISETPLSKTIQSISSKSNKSWVTEVSFLENFSEMNGGNSFTGVYAYPQLDLWSSLNTPSNKVIYNRYAHVVINLDRNTSKTPTTLLLPVEDHVGVVTEPCGSFLQHENVGFAITQVPLNKHDTCATKITSVKYPSTTFFIYEIR